MEEDIDKTPYLVPRNVVTRFEFYPGFGFFEVGCVLLSIIASVILFFFLGLFTLSLKRLFVFLLIPPVAVYMFLPMTDGYSLFSVLGLLKKWSLSKKTYLYEKRGF